MTPLDGPVGPHRAYTETELEEARVEAESERALAAFEPMVFNGVMISSSGSPPVVIHNDDPARQERELSEMFYATEQ